MPKELHFQTTPAIASSTTLLKQFICKKEGYSQTEINCISILKRSIDARQKDIKVNLKVAVYLKNEPYSL